MDVFRSINDRDCRKRVMNVSLVYNNKKLIGKCNNFSIEKVQGTSPFVMLENFEPKQPQLNESQQIVLEWLKSTWIDRKKNYWFPFEVINSLYYQFDVAWGKVSYEEFKRIEKDKPYIKAYGELTALEQFEVIEVFSRWALEQEEE